MTRLNTLVDLAAHAFDHPKVKRTWFLLAGVLVLDLLLLVVFWLPPARQESRLTQKIADNDRDRLSAEMARHNVATYAQLSRRSKELEGKWSTPVSQAQLVGQLSRLAAQEGLRVVSQEFEEDSGEAQGHPFHQRFSVVGSYASTRRFLIAIEQLPTLTIVQEARLEKAGDNTGQIRATFRLTTFTQAVGR